MGVAMRSRFTSGDTGTGVRRPREQLAYPHAAQFIALWIVAPPDRLNRLASQRIASAVVKRRCQYVFLQRPT
jgi:hypothetical protein